MSTASEVGAGNEVWTDNFTGKRRKVHGTEALSGLRKRRGEAKFLFAVEEAQGWQIGRFDLYFQKGRQYNSTDCQRDIVFRSERLFGWLPKRSFFKAMLKLDQFKRSFGVETKRRLFLEVSNKSYSSCHCHRRMAFTCQFEGAYSDEDRMGLGRIVFGWLPKRLSRCKLQ